MDEESKSSGFIVKDKRRFSSEGNFQGEPEGEVQSVSPASSKPAPTVTHETKTGEPGKAVPTKAAPSTSVGASADPTPSDVQFHSLIISLATQALVLLGEAPGPEGMEIAQDVPAAKQTIDMLLMLQEKTHGNIRDEEDRLLTEILRELQMSFVRASQKQRAV